MNAGPLQNRRDAEADHVRVVPGDQDVARLQRAVPDTRGRRAVERIGEMAQTRQRVGDRCRSVLAQRDVQRLAGGERRDEIRIGTMDTRIDHGRRSRDGSGPIR